MFLLRFTECIACSFVPPSAMLVKAQHTPENLLEQNT